MEPVINCEEKIGKTVGRRKVAPIFKAGSTIASARALAKLFKTPRFPRGVFRFKTHEEADEWMIKVMIRKTGSTQEIPPTKIY